MVGFVSTSSHLSVLDEDPVAASVALTCSDSYLNITLALQEWSIVFIVNAARWPFTSPLTEPAKSHCQSICFGISAAASPSSSPRAMPYETNGSR